MAIVESGVVRDSDYIVRGNPVIFLNKHNHKPHLERILENMALL
jgi:hypothetical protein